MKYRKAKYIYWQSETENYFIVVNDFKAKEEIRRKVNLKFKKIKEYKKPLWFNSTLYGFAVDKAIMKDKLKLGFPKVEIKENFYGCNINLYGLPKMAPFLPTMPSAIV